MQPAKSNEKLRLLLVAVVTLIPGVVLLVNVVRGDSLYLGATVVAMLALTVLAVARFDYAAGRARRATRWEAVLSQYAAELMAAGDEEELFAAARRTATELAGDGRADLVMVGHLQPAPGDRVLRAPVEVRGQVVAELVVDGDPARLERVHTSLTTVAAQLSLALERERLLETERETAEKLTEQNARLRDSIG